MSDTRPIGVFDSGIGGLTVLRELLQTFPNESFIYLGDTARLPYGSKSPETISRYVQENISFLLARDCKCIVVACNSASTQLRLPNEFSCPVFSVIDPGVEAALNATTNYRIGLIATEATVQSQAYQSRILKQRPEAQIFSQACPLFVPLVEEGWHEDPITNLIVFRYLNHLRDQQIDTLIMGCTHYPLLTDAFKKVFGPDVKMVDSGKAVALGIQKSSEIRFANPEPNQRLETSLVLAFTDLSARTKQISNYILRDPKNELFLETKKVTFEIVSIG